MKRSKGQSRPTPTRAAAPAPPAHNGAVGLLAAMAGVALVVALAYLPVLHCRAISYDDNEYLRDNWLVQNPSLDSAGKFFSEVTAPSTVRGYYQPLAMVSLMLDVAAGGSPENLRPFRMTSLLLHVANTALIVLLLYLLFGSVPAAAIAGLFFGLHPLTVESVAWTADRKTVLASLFGLLCLIAYVRFARARDAASPAGGTPSAAPSTRTYLLYGAALAGYALALLAKPTVTPIAVLLFVIDWWPLRRFSRRTALEKVPFILVGGVSAVISYVSQRNTLGLTPPNTDSAGLLVLVICHDIVFYLGKLVLPVGLTPHYPKPALSLASPAIIASIAGTVALVFVLIASLRRTRAPVAAFAFFMLGILPTIGIVGFTNVLTSDKYVYYPVLGLLMLLAAAIGYVWRNARSRGIVLAGAVLLMGAEVAVLRSTLAHWKDSESLALHMLKVSPEIPEPYVMLGYARSEAGDNQGAINAYRQALAIDPTHHPAYYEIGWILASLGRDEEAIEHYRASLKLAPWRHTSRTNLANLLAKRGDFAEALQHYAAVLERRPGSAQAHYNVAGVLLALGQAEEGTNHLQIAAQLRPDRPDILNNLGMALAARGDLDAALSMYTRAVQLEPDDPVTYYNMANALAGAGRHEEAVRRYADAIRLRPDYASAHNNMANSLRQLGRRDAAIAAFKEALRLEPNHARAHANLADTLAELGNWQEAAAHYEQSLRVRSTPRGQYRYGLALVELGRRDEAAAAFREALRLDPQFADAQRELAAVSTVPASQP